jgi:proton-dependent oligopeptide transporter, POT family
MVPAARITADVGVASAWWLIGNLFFATIGELYLSPVGLSLVTKVAPARLVSMVMGLWFLSYFAGEYMSGLLGTYWEKISKEQFFIMMAAIAIVSGFCMLIFSRPLKRSLNYADAKTNNANPDLNLATT